MKMLAPANLDELLQRLASNHAHNEKFPPITLTALNRVLEHAPEDMTVVVEAGISLEALQKKLATRGQWLPIDPPRPEATSIGDLLNANTSGPRRFGYGTVRDYLIGIKVALADGRVIKAGGKVVKNVAGYDLCKLFVGSQGSLGIIVEAAFKLRPLPEAEQFVAARCESLDQAAGLMEAVLASELTPVVADWHPPLPPATRHACAVVLGFAGTRAEVDWQLAKAAAIGITEPASLEYETIFWGAESRPHRLSVAPPRLAEAIEKLRAVEWVARAGNGVAYYRGGTPPPKGQVPIELTRRIKDAYDPKHLLPELTW
jgi:FAD/FMN-containing dehydrogenase